MPDPADRVWEFLERDVPFTGTQPWFQWQESCNRLGQEAAAVFIEALRTGPEHTHYPAVLGLRIFGYEAYGEGDGEKRTYRYRKIGAEEWVHINPVSKPPDYNDPDNWIVIGRGK